MPTIPTTMPAIIMSQTMVMHMPTPRMIAPATPSSVMAIARPLNTMARLPDIFLRTRTMTSSMTAPAAPTTMPGINAPHSGISAMHMPSAKRMPPTVLSMSVTKSFFCIFKTSVSALNAFQLTGRYYPSHVLKMLPQCFQSVKSAGGEKCPAPVPRGGGCVYAAFSMAVMVTP